MKTWVSVAILFAFVVHDAIGQGVAARPGAREILTFRLGMSVEQVRGMLKGAGLIERSASTGSVAGTTYIGQIKAYNPVQAPNASEWIDFVFAPPPSKNGLIGMFREVNYGMSKDAPTIDAFNSSVETKYGPPTVKAVYNYPTWHYDSSRDGRPLSKDAVNQCRVLSDSVNQGVLIPTASGIRSANDYVKRVGPMNCGLVMVVEVIPEKNGVVALYRIKMADLEAARAAVEMAAQMLNSMAEAANKKQVQDAQTKKPAL